jgi:hypothetical protein
MISLFEKIDHNVHLMHGQVTQLPVPVFERHSGRLSLGTIYV